MKISKKTVLEGFKIVVLIDLIFLFMLILSIFKLKTNESTDFWTVIMVLALITIIFFTSVISAYLIDLRNLARSNDLDEKT